MFKFIGNLIERAAWEYRLHKIDKEAELFAHYYAIHMGWKER